MSGLGIGVSLPKVRLEEKEQKEPEERVYFQIEKEICFDEKD